MSPTARPLLLVSITAVAVTSFHLPSGGRPLHPPTLSVSGRPPHHHLNNNNNDKPFSRTSRTRLGSEASGGVGSGRGKNGKTKWGEKTDADVSRFLTDFRTADGAVVDPYRLLRVKRTATTTEIKQSYRRLSRKLHPDMVAQSEILPGNCADLDEVRDEWERVKFSYEILSDPKVRKSYDRNSSVAEVLEDPGGAVVRGVVGTALGGMGMVLGGAWKLGEMATKTVYDKVK